MNRNELENLLFEVEAERQAGIDDIEQYVRGVDSREKLLCVVLNDLEAWRKNPGGMESTALRFGLQCVVWKRYKELVEDGVKKEV